MKIQQLGVNFLDDDYRFNDFSFIEKRVWGPRAKDFFDSGMICLCYECMLEDYQGDEPATIRLIDENEFQPVEIHTVQPKTENHLRPCANAPVVQ